MLSLARTETWGGSGVMGARKSLRGLAGPVGETKALSIQLVTGDEC